MKQRNSVPITPWTTGLVALDNRIGHDGTVWGEDFVLSDLSAFASNWGLFRFALECRMIYVWSRNVCLQDDIFSFEGGREG